MITLNNLQAHRRRHPQQGPVQWWQVFRIPTVTVVIDHADGDYQEVIMELHDAMALTTDYSLWEPWFARVEVILETIG
jgi:hypothetical protein